MSEAVEKPKAKAAKAKPEFRAVFGTMVHAFTGTRFEVGQPTEHEEDSWVESQVEAGKLEKI